MAKYRVCRNIHTGRRHIMVKESTPQKSKKRVFKNITGWKSRHNGNTFIYDEETVFLTESLEILNNGEYVDIPLSLIKELQEEYFASLEQDGKRVVYTTTHRARNQKYVIREA